MDKTPLVGPQVEEGRKLLESLAATGFEIEVAFWMLGTDYQRWRLFIASPIVARSGAIAAFRLIHEVAKSLPRSPWFDRFDIIAVAPEHPAAKAVEAFIAEYPGPLPLRVEGVSRNGLYFVDSYIYPKFAAVGAPVPA